MLAAVSPRARPVRPPAGPARTPGRRSSRPGEGQPVGIARRASTSGPGNRPAPAPAGRWRRPPAAGGSRWSGPPRPQRVDQMFAVHVPVRGQGQQPQQRPGPRPELAEVNGDAVDLDAEPAEAVHRTSGGGGGAGEWLRCRGRVAVGPRSAGRPGRRDAVVGAGGTLAVREPAAPRRCGLARPVNRRIAPRTPSVFAVSPITIRAGRWSPPAATASAAIARACAPSRCRAGAWVATRWANSPAPGRPSLASTQACSDSAHRASTGASRRGKRLAASANSSGSAAGSASWPAIAAASRSRAAPQSSPARSPRPAVRRRRSTARPVTRARPAPPRPARGPVAPPRATRQVRRPVRSDRAGSMDRRSRRSPGR